MKKYLYILLAAVLGLVSCSETDNTYNTYNPYENWQSRNAKWYEDTVQVARQAIAQAQAEYGEEWEDHCQWRMYKSLFKSPGSTGPLTDSICVRILERGADPLGKGSPAYNDSVHISYRGWMMPVYNYTGNGSCEMGRRSFCRDRGIDPETVQFTVEEFVRLTCDSYGSDVICQLADRLSIKL